jgi:hypothetical protein
VFKRGNRLGGSAPVDAHRTDWLHDSSLRQLFDRDLEEGERILHTCAVTVTSPRFDRPVRGWAVATDRALRMRWGLATAVRQSLHVGHDRMRRVEIAPDDPHTVRLTYFDAARTTSGWYQELRLRAECPELARALEQRVGGQLGV